MKRREGGRAAAAAPELCGEPGDPKSIIGKLGGGRGGDQRLQNKGSEGTSRATLAAGAEDLAKCWD